MDRLMPRMLLGAVLVAVVPLITGAASDGCGGGDVTVGTDEPGECWTGTGCAVTVCAEGPPQSVTCELTLEKECIMWRGICERDEDGECGWRQSEELLACFEDPRMPVLEPCAKITGDTCDSDADCATGGCGGEVCFNPALSDGASDCDCAGPMDYGCGCVRGTCTWFE